MKYNFPLRKKGQNKTEERENVDFTYTFSSEREYILYFILADSVYIYSWKGTIWFSAKSTLKFSDCRIQTSKIQVTYAMHENKYVIY